MPGRIFAKAYFSFLNEFNKIRAFGSYALFAEISPLACDILCGNI